PTLRSFGAASWVGPIRRIGRSGLISRVGRGRILSRGLMGSPFPFTLALSLWERGVVVVEFGIELGEGFVRDGREEVFEGHAVELDAKGFRDGVAGLAPGFGFFGFSAGHEFFGEANLSDVFVERGVAWAGKVEVFFFDFAE